MLFYFQERTERTKLVVAWLLGCMLRYRREQGYQHLLIPTPTYPHPPSRVGQNYRSGTPARPRAFEPWLLPLAERRVVLEGLRQAVEETELRDGSPGLFIWTSHDSTGKGVNFQPACLPP